MAKALYYGQPINWGHPLNCGLLLRWKIAPWYTSGPRLIDLANQNHGILTGGPTWAGDAIRCDANGEGVEITAPASLKTVPVTISIWIKSIGTPTNSSNIWTLTTNNTDSDPYTSYGLGVGNSGEVAWNGNQEAGAFFRASTAVALASLTDWTLLVGVQNAAGNVEIYRSGVDGMSSIYSDATGRNLPSYTATSLLAAGNYTGISRNSNILVDDGCVWNRALSAAEIALLYDDQRRGSPQTLNWISSKPWNFAASAAVAATIFDFVPNTHVPRAKTKVIAY